MGLHITVPADPAPGQEQSDTGEVGPKTAGCSDLDSPNPLEPMASPARVLLSISAVAGLGILLAWSPTPQEAPEGFAIDNQTGGEKAYALYETVGRYEFWEFDLVSERVTRRQPFEGRPRMGLRVSADGEKLYVFIAGNTIDVYDTGTLELLRTVAFDEDMRPSVVIPGSGPGR